MEQENREMEEITIKDIARMCGVGVSTVSRAINNHPDINPETKQKVMGIIQKYGYIPNNSARYLKRTDGKCIAVLVKGLTNPFFAGAIKIMEDEIKKKKYSMVIRHVESDEDEVDVPAGSDNLSSDILLFHRQQTEWSNCRAGFRPVLHRLSRG